MVDAQTSPEEFLTLRAPLGRATQEVAPRKLTLTLMKSAMLTCISHQEGERLKLDDTPRKQTATICNINRQQALFHHSVNGGEQKK